MNKIEYIVFESKVEVKFIDYQGLLTPQNLFIDRLIEISDNKEVISYHELLGIVSGMLQIIDCEIKFILLNDEYLILRCIDSSYWEIETNNPNDVKSIFKLFLNVKLLN